MRLSCQFAHMGDGTGGDVSWAEDVPSWVVMRHAALLVDRERLFLCAHDASFRQA